MLTTELAGRLQSIAAIQGRIDGVLEMASLADGDVKPPITPCAFVVKLGSDASAGDAATGIHRQKVSHRIGIVLVLEKPDDPRGEATLGELEALESAIIGLVAGWRAPSAADAFHLARGRLLRMSRGTAFYQIDFVTSTYVRTSNG